MWVLFLRIKIGLTIGPNFFSPSASIRSIRLDIDCINLLQHMEVTKSKILEQ